MAIVQKQKRKRFNVFREVKELSAIYPDLPSDGECFKAVSCGNFSSIAFIMFVAQKTKINRMYASTLRVGRKHLFTLDALHKKGNLDYCGFVVGSIMKEDQAQEVKKYQYYNDLKAVCEKNGWGYAAINNHSKVILFDTDVGKFVLETSSNLNENPNIEQFSFEKDEQLFLEYFNVFRDVFGLEMGDKL